MATKIQIRRDTAINWTNSNVILSQGELGLELDTQKLKIGDGITNWVSLPYYSGGGSGTVTNISATDSTGIDFTITNPTTTPNISLSLTKSAVGLANVDNTSDLNKPISTATQTALDNKQNSLGYTPENIANKSTNTSLGTSDTSYPTQNAVKTYVDTGLGTKENTITAGTVSQYYRGDKTFQTLDKSAVGLSNVDNTSDATKNSTTATLTNKTIDLTNNALTGTLAQFNTALSDGDFATLANTVTLTNKTLSTGTIIENATGTTNVQTGTTYTLLASDNGKIITLNNASAITLTVSSGLGAGFNCTVIQKGAGQVTFTASGTTIVNRQNHTKTAGQHAVCGLYADVANNFYLTGDTAV